MKYNIFDRTALKIRSLSERRHGLDISSIKNIEETITDTERFPSLCKIAQKIVNARCNSKSIIMLIGAHVIRSGVQRYLIDLMERKYISCLAMNGAGIIHDFELALIGKTTESVSKYIKEGQFGLWKETGRINNIINKGYKKNLGMGEALGSAIARGKFPNKEVSLLAAGHRAKVPVTIHVGIGYDIIHEHPNCDGAATGAMSYKDFLRFVSVVENLEGGVVMNFGSSVMAPEIFLKALSMARNVAHQNGRVIKHFTSLVCDLKNLPDDFSKEPEKDNDSYYFRPWKTMLVRTVADGGESFYVKGKHADTLPALWVAINEEEKNKYKET